MPTSIIKVIFPTGFALERETLEKHLRDGIQFNGVQGKIETVYETNGGSGLQYRATKVKLTPLPKERKIAIEKINSNGCTPFRVATIDSDIRELFWYLLSNGYCLSDNSISAKTAIEKAEA